MSDENRTAVIVAGNLDMLEPLVESAGYFVAGVACTGVNGERMIEYVRPDVIVIENELAGEQGWQLLARFHDLSPASKVVLVVADGWAPTELGAVGAFAVLARSGVGSIVEILHDLDTWIDLHVADGTVQSDRRSGRDRRLHQDWTKVGWERRDGLRRTLKVSV